MAGATGYSACPAQEPHLWWLQVSGHWGREGRQWSCCELTLTLVSTVCRGDSTHTQTHTHTDTHKQLCYSVLTLTLVSPVCSGDSCRGLRDAELLHHEDYCDSGSAPSNCRRLIWQLMLKQHSSSLWGNNASAWGKHNDTSDSYTQIPLPIQHIYSHSTAVVC